MRGLDVRSAARTAAIVALLGSGVSVLMTPTPAYACGGCIQTYDGSCGSQCDVLMQGCGGGSCGGVPAGNETWCC